MSIHIKPENRGKFTAKAKRAGMGVQEYARKEAHDPNASAETKKEAVFAETAPHWNHGGRVGRKKGTLRPRVQGTRHHPEHKKV